MKLGLIGGAALLAALLTPFAITVVGATAPGPRLADPQAPVGALQTMQATEQVRTTADGTPARPAQPVAVRDEPQPDAACTRTVRVVGPSYGEPVLCRK